MEYLPSMVLQIIHIYTVNFGESSGEPSCSCFHWTKWNIPCKHFFAIFRLIPNWTWNRLPSSYRSSTYLSTKTALQNLPLSTELLPKSSATVTELCNDVEVTDGNLTVTDMPHKPVCDLFVEYILLFSLVCVYSYHRLPHSGIVSGRSR